MREINGLFIDIGNSLGLPLFPFSASSFAVAENRHLVHGDVSSIELALKKGFIPVVYGDVVTDKKQGVSIASTEMIFEFLSSKLKPSKIILGTDVDGVFNKNPTLSKDAKLIPIVGKNNLNYVLHGSTGSIHVDVSGGMKTKITMLYRMVKNTGATGYIINANKPGNISKILKGEKAKYTLIKQS